MFVIHPNLQTEMKSEAQPPSASVSIAKNTVYNHKASLLHVPIDHAEQALH